jgi:hypothetical protein
MTKKIILLLFLTGAVVLIFSVKIMALFDFINNGNSEEISNSMPSSSTGHVNISAELLSVNGTGTLSVEFEGAQNKDLIVISIDSKEASLSRPVPLVPNEIDLFGIILVRAVQQQNTATLVFHHQDLVRHLQDDLIFISVYLVKNMDLLLMEGDPSVMGSEKVIDRVRITNEDCTQDFQYVYPNENDFRLKNIFQNARRFSHKSIEGMRCSATIKKTSIKSTTTVEK